MEHDHGLQHWYGGGEQRTIRTLVIVRCGAVEIIQRRVLENEKPAG
jgi:hypothetical protein